MRRVKDYNDVVKCINDYVAKFKPRSQWDKGVVAQMYDFAEIWHDNPNAPTQWDKRADFEKTLLNGATTWTEYSYSGCALIYDDDIIDRYATPSEKRHAPNKLRENALDIQARACRQAASDMWFYVTYRQ